MGIMYGYNTENGLTEFFTEGTGTKYLLTMPLKERGQKCFLEFTVFQQQGHQ